MLVDLANLTDGVSYDDRRNTCLLICCSRPGCDRICATLDACKGSVLPPFWILRLESSHTLMISQADCGLTCLACQSELYQRLHQLVVNC